MCVCRFQDYWNYLFMHLVRRFTQRMDLRGAFGRNLCKFTFPQRRRNLRKSLLNHTRPTGAKRAKKWLR